MVDKSFSPMEIDAIGEILNISLGASATAISTMLNTRVDITTPSVSVVSADEFCFKDLEPAIGVEINYVSGLEGRNIMLLKRSDIKVIVELLMGSEISDDEFELNEMNLSAVCEVMNQMMGASSTALSEFLERSVNISTPVSFEINSEEVFKEKYLIPDVKMVVVKFLLNINGKLESEFVNVMPTELVKDLLSVFLPNDYADGMGENESAAAEPPAASGKPSESVQPASSGRLPEPVQPSVPGQLPESVQSMPGYDFTFQQQMMASLQSMQNEIQSLKKQDNKVISGIPLQYNTLNSQAGNGEDQEENLDLLMGVSLEIAIEIGRTRGFVKDILEYKKGTLVVLDKQAGDPVDLYVNGRCIAKGDVVVVDDSFGIRISEIVKKPI